MTDLADMGPGEVAALISSGQVSSVEVTQACPSAPTDATEPRLNAVSLRLPDSALTEARRAGAEITGGQHLDRLHGIPVAVKEMFDLAGHPTTGSFRAYPDNVATGHSAAVDRLKQAHAVIIGKTHTHELAYGVTTPQSRNPWGTDHTPGGSSGGSATSVAAVSNFMALGTDTGGSIRIPAACCGVTGFKPTFGLCSTFGPVFRSSTVARLRHFATVLGLIPGFALSATSEACDRCIAARTACAVVAQP